MLLCWMVSPSESQRRTTPPPAAAASRREEINPPGSSQCWRFEGITNHHCDNHQLHLYSYASLASAARRGARTAARAQRGGCRRPPPPTPLEWLPLEVGAQALRRAPQHLAPRGLLLRLVRQLCEAGLGVGRVVLDERLDPGEPAWRARA
jgi:hypothetical protein